MESFRLKNIIICILALLNLCLLASLIDRNVTQHNSRRQAEEQLVELFAADGVTLDAKLISSKSPPAAKALDRSLEEDKTLAGVFLGVGLTVTDQGGGIYTYGNNAGAALFPSNGGFDIIGTQVQEDAESFCRKFCKEYQYRDLVFLLDETQSGVATAVRYYEGYPVFNCTITFTLERGALTKVSGMHLPGTWTEIGGEKPLSATAALTTFLDNMRRESSAVVSAITDLYLCYEVQSTKASPMTLVPAWCIVTDTATYYVNCQTAAITHS